MTRFSVLTRPEIMCVKAEDVKAFVIIYFADDVFPVSVCLFGFFRQSRKNVVM